MNDRIARFSALVVSDPGNPLHRFALAQAQLAAGDFAGAEASFARCLELNPDWMVAAIRRGRCLLELGRSDEARAALLRGAELAAVQQHEEPLEEIRELLAQLPEAD